MALLILTVAGVLACWPSLWVRCSRAVRVAAVAAIRTYDSRCQMCKTTILSRAGFTMLTISTHNLLTVPSFWMNVSALILPSQAIRTVATRRRPVRVRVWTIREKALSPIWALILAAACRPGARMEKMAINQCASSTIVAWRPPRRMRALAVTVRTGIANCTNHPIRWMLEVTCGPETLCAIFTGNVFRIFLACTCARVAECTNC